MKAKHLSARQAILLWEKFCIAHGPETILAAYGWDRPPATLAAAERVWSFHEGRDLVGWGSSGLSLRDAEDDEAILELGVFPAFERKGWRGRILDWLADEARERGADRVVQIVKHSNTAHYARVLRESRVGPWVHSGEVWYPEPGYGIFTRPLNEGLPAASSEAPGETSESGAPEMEEPIQ